MNQITSPLPAPAPSSGDRLATPIVIVGHVDHGKSTLIGRLLHDSGNLAEGKLAAARKSSEARGLKIEWSFLLDSLQAERDQGVTIDSTRLPFSLDGRPFVIVDAPGHRQFIRNMITGAADAAAAVLVVDLAEGAREQTRRHAMLLRLIGVQHVIVLMNKADLLDYDEVRIAQAQAAIGALLERLGIVPRAMIPASAREGANVFTRAAEMPWYSGPTLAEALSEVRDPPAQTERPLRLPVQDVYRDGERRHVVGRVESGRLAVGDTLAVGTTGATARVARFVAWSAEAPQTVAAGQSTALLLDPDVVVERGDVLHRIEPRPEDAPLRSARLRARLFWLRPEPLRIGESFRLRLGTADVAVTVAEIAHAVDLDDLVERAAESVPQDGFAEVVLAASQALLFDAFTPGGLGGRGVLADAYGRIVGAAPILGAAELPVRGPAVHPIDSAVTLADRARKRGHHGGVFWLTGLPGAGKSTLAKSAEANLFAQGVDVVVLDGDSLRARLNADLGFEPADRLENVRRTAAVARLMAEAGLVVLVALISPLRAHRSLARQLVGEGFHEIHIHADPETCERRDPKGHYAAARAGALKGFTGTNGGYETPEAPDLLLDTTTGTPEEVAARLRRFAEARIGLVGHP